MQKPLDIIYVPGLGDPRYPQQGWLVKLWRIYGVQTHYMPLIWGDGDAFKPKFQRLLNKIDKFAGQGHNVGLVGTSAGASAVLNAFTARPKAVCGVVCLCGKINNPQTISNYTRHNNPAFSESIDLLQQNLPKLTAAQREHILSIHPLADGVVPPLDTIIEGAHEQTIPSVTHMLSIAYGISVGSYAITHFLKKQAQSI